MNIPAPQNAAQSVLLTAFLAVIASAQNRTLTADSLSSQFGKAVILTATANPACATGKVTFFDGAAILGFVSSVSNRGINLESLMASGVVTYREKGTR